MSKCGFVSQSRDWNPAQRLKLIQSSTRRPSAYLSTHITHSICCPKVFAASTNGVDVAKVVALQSRDTFQMKPHQGAKSRWNVDGYVSEVGWRETALWRPSEHSVVQPRNTAPTSRDMSLLVQTETGSMSRSSLCCRCRALPEARERYCPHWMSSERRSSARMAAVPRLAAEVGPWTRELDAASKYLTSPFVLGLWDEE